MSFLSLVVNDVDPISSHIFSRIHFRRRRKWKTQKKHRKTVLTIGKKRVMSRKKVKHPPKYFNFMGRGVKRILRGHICNTVWAKSSPCRPQINIFFLFPGWLSELQRMTVNKPKLELKKLERCIDVKLKCHFDAFKSLSTHQASL